MNCCEIVFLNDALSDMSLAFEYLINVAKNPNAAKSLITDIQKKIEQIKTFPYFFPTDNDPILETKGFRRATVGSYVLFYVLRKDLNKVIIVGVFHGKRDYAALLLNR